MQNRERTTFGLASRVHLRRVPRVRFFRLMAAAAIISVISPTRAQPVSHALPAPTNLAAYKAGALLRLTPMPGAPAGSVAWRILYRSTGIQGEPIAVSGAVIVPVSPVPSGGRPVVAWAHPTTGVAEACAPSLARVFFQSIPGLRAMLAAGYAVSATDYPGLGTPQVHPYLVGVSEARAVIDSVRAAHSIPGLGSGRSFAVWGHSQGGHAALFTGLLAASYAPELNLVGVAAAAPATDLRALLLSDLDTSGGRNITAMTLWSWARVYRLSLATVLTPEAVPVVGRLASLCIERFFDVLTRRGPTQALARSFLKVRDFADIEPWRSLLAQNTPQPLPARLPVFLAQGSTDNLVSPSITLAYRNKLCARGAAVEMVMLPNVGHLFVARISAPAAIAWLGDRFVGRAAPNNCQA